MSARDRILNSQDLERAELDIPEWGGQVFYRELTGIERDELTDLYIEAQVTDPATGTVKQLLPKHYKAKICIMGVIDEDGSNVFTKEHLERVAAKSARCIDTVSSAITKISGMAGVTIEGAQEDFIDDRSEDGGSESLEL